MGRRPYQMNINSFFFFFKSKKQLQILIGFLHSVKQLTVSWPEFYVFIQLSIYPFIYLFIWTHVGVSTVQSTL